MATNGHHPTRKPDYFRLWAHTEAGDIGALLDFNDKEFANTARDLLLKSGFFATIYSCWE